MRKGSLLRPVRLRIYEKLARRDYRETYFVAEAEAEIAQQLIALRKRRKLTQAALAKLCGTKQPAIARLESADYRCWNIRTLWKVVHALNGRMSFKIEPLEDVREEYRD